MNNNKTRISFILGLTSLLIWLTSLASTGLVFYGSQNLSGFNILLSGWLGPLSLSFSWYANIYFLYSVFLILEGKKLPIKSAGFACLLASTMFLFKVLPSGSGGGTLLYGYGIGSILWLNAISLNYLAACVRELELTGKKLSLSSVKSDINGAFAIFSLLTYTVTFSVFGFMDHKSASIAEKKYLNHAVFKIEPVCELPDIKPSETVSLVGPLKVEDKVSSYNQELSSPRLFLSWGIPSVRKNGFDYALSDPEDIDSIYVTPAKGDFSTALYSNSSIHGNVEAKLVRYLNSEQTIVFDAHWTITDKGQLYCPRYIEDHETHEPLRSLIVSSLSSQNHKSFKAVPKRIPDQLNGPRGINNQDLVILSKEKVGWISQIDIKLNNGCPENTGLFNRKSPEWVSKTKDLDYPTDFIFIHENKIHFVAPSTIGLFNAFSVCDKDSVYLFSPEPRFSGKNSIETLHIQKFSINHFNREWKKVRNLKFNPQDFGISIKPLEQITYRPISVIEDGNKIMVVKFAAFEKDAQVGNVVEIKAKL